MPPESFDGDGPVQELRDVVRTTLRHIPSPPELANRGGPGMGSTSTSSTSTSSTSTSSTSTSSTSTSSTSTSTAMGASATQLIDLMPKGFPNAALLMRYENGDDSSGQHRDDEIDLGYERAIMGISLGEEGSGRTLEFRKVANNALVKMVMLQPGDALIMLGFTIQEKFTHELVKEKVSIFSYHIPLPPFPHLHISLSGERVEEEDMCQFSSPPLHSREAISIMAAADVRPGSAGNHPRSEEAGKEGRGIDAVCIESSKHTTGRPVGGATREGKTKKSKLKWC
jgi:hypothetical protein